MISYFFMYNPNWFSAFSVLDPQQKFDMHGETFRKKQFP